MEKLLLAKSIYFDESNESDLKYQICLERLIKCNSLKYIEATVLNVGTMNLLCKLKNRFLKHVVIKGSSEILNIFASGSQIISKKMILIFTDTKSMIEVFDNFTKERDGPIYELQKYANFKAYFKPIQN